MRVTLVHNPTAGDERESAASLRAAIEAYGHEVTYASVKDDDWPMALDESPDLVVAAGGDGTVRKVFKEVAGQQVPVTLIPLGTANNIATALGFDTDDPSALVARWETSARRAYDSGHVAAPWGETVFFEAFGGGTFAELLGRAEAEGKRSGGEDKVAKGLRLLGDLLRDQAAQRWEIELDDRSSGGEYLAVEVMNTPATGPNVPLAPGADPSDGRFDVVVIADDHREALRGYVDERRHGRDAEPPALERQRAQRVRLLAPDGAQLRIDDELWPEDGEPSGRVVTVTPRWKLEVLVPVRGG